MSATALATEDACAKLGADILQRLWLSENLGTFEGSPIELLHQLSVEKGKIVSLTISAAGE